MLFEPPPRRVSLKLPMKRWSLKMKAKFAPILIVQLVLFLCIPDSTLADNGVSALLEGMRSGDVVQAWGEPSSRQIFEAKREELWIYPQRQVRFREGKVAQWEDLERTEREAELPLALIGAEATSTDSEKQVAVADILSEIMKEGEAEEKSGRR